MIKDLSKLQISSKHAMFAMRLTELLLSRQIDASPVAFVSAFNKANIETPIKPHTARKWLLGMTQPRSATLLRLSNWLQVKPSYLFSDTEIQFSESIFLEFDDSENNMIRTYYSLPEVQKEIIRQLVDIFARKNL
jgi:hypothetical protein